ncbi:MAG: YciI family protein [Planctomycetota bacterium]|nr:MAG: YciI family protein [Planctomycetota bacterium]
MLYMLMIADVEKEQLGPRDPGFEELMAEYQAFGELVEKLGVMRAGHRLQPTATATTVRVRDGKTLTTDGPFVETKEQFGGYYLLDCKDLDQAIELAGKIPSAKHGSIEIRPVWCN